MKNTNLKKPSPPDGEPDDLDLEGAMAMREIARLTLPERLRFHRQRQSLTLRQVSIVSDVTESHLSQIERGVVRDPRLRTLIRIAEALEVPVEALVKNLPEDDD
jgi:DNA-binding XRE family transcriptional regulator